MKGLKGKKLLQSKLEVKQKDKALYLKTINYLTKQKQRVNKVSESNQIELINNGLERTNNKVKQLNDEIEVLKKDIKDYENP